MGNKNLIFGEDGEIPFSPRNSEKTAYIYVFLPKNIAENLGGAA